MVEPGIRKGSGRRFVVDDGQADGVIVGAAGVDAVDFAVEEELAAIGEVEGERGQGVGGSAKGEFGELLFEAAGTGGSGEGAAEAAEVVGGLFEEVAVAVGLVVAFEEVGVLLLEAGGGELEQVVELVVVEGVPIEFLLAHLVEEFLEGVVVEAADVDGVQAQFGSGLEVEEVAGEVLEGAGGEAFEAGDAAVELAAHEGGQELALELGSVAVEGAVEGRADGRGQVGPLEGDVGELAAGGGEVVALLGLGEMGSESAG